MVKLVKAEIYKFSNSISLWLILFVLTAFASISIFTGVYNSAENVLFNMSKDIMVPILACAVYGGLTLCNDFSDGTIMHYIVSGFKRSQVILIKYVCYLLSCIILITIYFWIVNGLGFVMLGTEFGLAKFVDDLCKYLRSSLIFYLCISSTFFLISVILRRGSLAVSLSVAYAIMDVVITNKAYYDDSLNKSRLLNLSPVIRLEFISDIYDEISIMKKGILVSAAWLVIVYILSCFIAERVEL